MKVITCNRSSASANKLAEAMGIECLVLKRGKYPEFDGTKYINYGCSWLDHTDVVLNNGCKTMFVRNKLAFFDLVKYEFDSNIVPYTTEKSVAYLWNKDHDIFVRQQKLGCNSDGLIHIPKGTGEFPDGKFYTRRVYGKEHRAYFYKKGLLAIYEKQPKTPYPVKNWKFVLKFKGDIPNSPVRKSFTGHLPEFLALDYILTDDDECFILEGNTAPILFPTVINKLVKIIGG